VLENIPRFGDTNFWRVFQTILRCISLSFMLKTVKFGPRSVKNRLVEPLEKRLGRNLVFRKYTCFFWPYAICTVVLCFRLFVRGKL